MKKKTLEKAAENYGWRIKRNTFSDAVKANELAESAQQDFIAGAKYQAERMYSEEDLISFYNFIENHQLRKYGDVWRRITNDSKDKPLNFESVDDQYIIDWFEQFKKK